MGWMRCLADRRTFIHSTQDFIHSGFFNGFASVNVAYPMARLVNNWPFRRRQSFFWLNGFSKFLLSSSFLSFRKSTFTGFRYLLLSIKISGVFKYLSEKA